MIMLIPFLMLFSNSPFAASLEIGSLAPPIQTQTHAGKPFDLNERKGKWTVLYFYPKADTPGCTKQACAFRDRIQKVRDLNGEVYGVSSDDVKALAEFHSKYHLNFPLLADPDLKAIEAYGTKMPLLPISKRWTFIIDPDLKIAFTDKNVDPVADVDKMAEKILELQKNKTPKSP